MIKEFIEQKDDLIFTGAVFACLMGYALLAGLSLLIPVLLIFYGFHLALSRKAGRRKFLHLGLLVAIIATTAHAMTSFSRFSPDYVPVACVAMLTVLLFNDIQLAFSMSFISAAVVTLITGMDAVYLLTLFIGGLAGAYTVRGARTRGILLSGGLVAGVLQALAFALAHPDWGPNILVHIRPFLINGIIAGFAALGTLRLFELLFGELTNFTLLELSDSLDQPLLKRLAFEAPGTYHHSLVLSNLAGAAADVIGANTLLTRVGAYYHDIGKLVKPHYFTENQSMMANKHDDLEPSMSRLVILNHVKEGSELARRNKLSQKVIDFIEQHHGTSLIHFFYRRALEEAENENEVKEEDFRYPGPKPQTREVALVMLADSVEGAVRALEDRTPTKVEEVVRRVVNNKFIDGQLDDCSLTLREINQICRSFTHSLSAMYHARVRYPEAKKNGNGK